MNKEMLNCALAYAERGWFVFPVHGIFPETGECTCGADHSKDNDKAKHPVLINGVKSATKTREKIEGWWGNENGQFWNIGIRTGEVSGITVLDIDTSGGKRGADTWGQLIKDKGEPETLTSKTGSGGAHVFFLYNASLKTSSNTLGPAVDCRNDDGYVIAPPSRHRSGGRYEWQTIDGTPSDESTPPATSIASLPAHLTKRIETRGRKKADDPKQKKYSIEQVVEMLEHIEANDRDLWRNVGIILGRTFDRSDAAFEAYQAWSDSWGGPKGRGHDDIMRQAFYDISQEDGGRELTLGTIVAAAISGGWIPEKGAVSVNDFVYLASEHKFFYIPSGDFWIEDAVNAAAGQVQDAAGNLMRAATFIQKNAMATSRGNSPDYKELIIKGLDMHKGSLVVSGGALLNTYRPADIELGDASLAEPFVAHVRRVFDKPGDADQFLDYMAHRTQKPGEKPRFALILAGEQGTGKDTCVEFCQPALGRWNVANVEPSDFDLPYNEYLTATLIRVSETSNTQDMSKWMLNERMKTMIAGNPDDEGINPKYGKHYTTIMFCGVIITTNHLATGIYIPPDDRRYDVIASATKAEMGLEDDAVRAKYFGDLWDWFGAGGSKHVAAYLNERIITHFSAAMGQRKTGAHKMVVASGYSQDHWLLDALEALGNPLLVRSDALTEVILEAGHYTVKELNAKMSHGMSRMGYEQVINEGRKDGRWGFSEDGKKAMTPVYKGSKMTMLEAMSKIHGLKKGF